VKLQICATTISAFVLGSFDSAQTPASFKVASWNIRSGMGIKALSGGYGPMFSSSTHNCTNPAQPMNAWGWGLPQRALIATIANDSSVIALGLQEAWGCGKPSNVRNVLGWTYASHELNGTALLARYGIKGPLFIKQIATRGIDGTEDQYLFGADVCADRTCVTTARIYTVHYAGLDEAQIAIQTRNTIRAINAQPHASHSVVAGDFNNHQRDLVVKPCGTRLAQSPGLLLWAENRYFDAWAFLRPHEDGDTGMWNRNGCGIPNGGLFKRIDYVMTRGFLPAAVDRWAMIDPATEDAPSDHAGIIATLRAGAGVPLPPPPSAARTEVVIRPGSQGSIVGSRWKVVNDPSAAGARAVSNPNLGESKIITASPRPASYIDLTFMADANTPYRLWIRAKAASNHWANDSVLVQFSDSVDAGGQPVFRIGSTSSTWWSLEEFSGQGERGWGWQDNGYGAPGIAGPRIRFATSGPHTLRLQQREDGVTIDQIVLSSVRYAAVSPGTQRDDTTILPAR
jgi:Endonuclease/Exonuclease/phosphatase family